MTYLQYWHFEDQEYEMLISQKNDCYIKDKINKKYYYEAVSSKDGATQLKKQIGDYIFPICIFVSLFLYAYSLYLYFSMDFTSERTYVTRLVGSIIFMLINIVLHEFGHVFVMKYYGRKIGSVKFRLNLIFPTVSVETTDSYLLPKFRRMYVYANGLVINVILASIVSLFFKQYIYLNSCVLMCVAANILPIGIVKSDGYHIWINLLAGKKDFKEKRNRVFAGTQIIFIAVTVLMGIATIVKLL